MAYRALGQFSCDLCGEESQKIELNGDALVAMTPERWLRIEASEARGGLDIIEVQYVCDGCKAPFKALFDKRGSA
jgi:hypothetical protein